MKKIRFLFYKAKVDGHLLDDAINIWTWTLAFISFQWNRLKYAYSHAEIWFLEDKSEFELSPHIDSSRWFVGQCFSSTTRGGAKGVRFAPACVVLNHPDRWDYIEVEISNKQYADIILLAETETGCLYDYKGIFGFFWFRNVQDPEKWYCSEICAYLADKIGLIKLSNYRISPRRLAKILSVKYGKPKSLK